MSDEIGTRQAFGVTLFGAEDPLVTLVLQNHSTLFAMSMENCP